MEEFKKEVRKTHHEGQIQSLKSENEDLRKQVAEYQTWDAARQMVIGYLRHNHGLTDQYQWAFKTIELLKQLEPPTSSTQTTVQ